MNRYFLLFAAFILWCTAVRAQDTPGYTSDTVNFKSADGKITFAGTLTVPRGGKAVPAVVIISGTYPQDRDGNMAGHPIFAQIAAHLSDNGIAVLRMDDRGTGKTTGVYETATTGDFADDALRAITYLKGVKVINPNRIGLLGHSEGGAAAAIAAAKSKDVAFIVSVAGLAMSGYESLIRQNEDLVNGSQLSEVDKKRSNEINGMMFKVAYKYAASDSLESVLNKTYADWKIKDDAYFKTLHIEFDHFRFPIYSFVRTAIGPWYRYFVRYNAPKTLAKVHVPILALNGDKDLMVNGEANLANWKNFSAAGGNRKVKTLLLSGLNHLFLPCQTCTVAEYRTINAGFSGRALDMITRWVLTLQPQ